MWLTILPDELDAKLVPCTYQDVCQRDFSLPALKHHLHLHIGCEDGVGIVPFPIMSTAGISRLLDMLDRTGKGWYGQMLPVLLQAPETQHIPKTLSFLERRILHHPGLRKTACSFGYYSGR